MVALEGKEIKREITLLAFPKILRCSVRTKDERNIFVSLNYSTLVL